MPTQRDSSTGPLPGPLADPPFPCDTVLLSRWLVAHHGFTDTDWRDLAAVRGDVARRYGEPIPGTKQPNGETTIYPSDVWRYVVRHERVRRGGQQSLALE